MSDHTSDTQNGLGAEAGEPSMEDILASIRRIIAEDDVSEGASAAKQVDIIDTVVAATSAPEDESVLVLGDAVEFDEVLDLSEVISDMEIPEPTVESPVEFNPVSGVVSDLETKLASDTESTVSEGTAMDELDLILADMNLLSSDDEDITDNSAEEFNLLKEDILSVIEDDVVIAPENDPSMDMQSNEIEDIILTEELALDEYVEEEETLVSGASESDLDLVKSLMADLTDTSFLETDAGTDSGTEDTITPIELEVEEEASIEFFEEAEVIEAESANSDQEQILNDILDMTLEGQEQENAQENLMEALELTVDKEPVLPETTIETPQAVDEEDNLLLQIAAAVEADATAEDTDIIEELMAVEPESDFTEPLEETLIETEEDMSLSVEDAEIIENIVEVDEAESADLFVEAPQETEEMPTRARKDAILDEVTETAAAGAFASLNQVVEDNAVFTESGPRIGDLVQDALRPMLKEWLDANLKTIVERAVAKEVKRISSGK